MTKQPSYRFGGYTEVWEEKKLGDVAEIVGGGTPSTSVPDYWDGDIDWYSPVEIGTKIFVNSSQRKITQQGLVKSSAKMLPIGTILFTSRAGIGSTAILAKEGCTNQGFQSIVPNQESLDNYFIFSLSHELKRYGEVTGAGSTFVEVSGKQMAKMPISLPSLPEQTAIGSFFQDIDQLISLQQRKLEVLKEQKKTYLKLLFPAKGQTKPALRFAGFEDEWKEVKLGEVLKKNNKKNRDLAINNVESVSNKLGFVKQTEQFEDYSVASADLSNYYVISEKQFAYNPSRINVGSIAYKKEGDTLSVVSPLYISFSTVESIDDSYLWYWFKTSLFDSQRAIYSEGGVRDTLSFNQLSDIELIFPSLPEQEAIGSFFQDLDKAIAKQEEKVNQLKESKQTLLRKMFI